MKQMPLRWMLLLILSVPALYGQMDHSHMNMPGMEKSGNDSAMFLMNQASGTSVNPDSWQMPMRMQSVGHWQTMFMGTAFLVDTQQSGPRGADKFYSANWFMGSVEHGLGKGSFSLDLMLSLDPATITSRRYPLLFQTGETAYGRPLIDAQHPHDFLMAFGVHYARRLGEETTFQAYFAPVGDPALGPVAFPHRATAMELPQATLGHHWEDSSHIANEVVTVGVKHRFLSVEASGFYGAEPNENRWNIDSGPMDSWSTRFSVMPSKNWVAQFSVGHLAHPEREEPGDVVRTTASVEYVRPMSEKTSWATSFIWGRNHKTLTERSTDAYTWETVFPIRRRNFVTGRFESVDKDELFPGADTAYRIGAYTAGYTRDFDLVPYLQTGLGANITAYTFPAALKPSYGDHPFGVNIYLRVRLRRR